MFRLFKYIVLFVLALIVLLILILAIMIKDLVNKLVNNNKKSLIIFLLVVDFLTVIAPINLLVLVRTIITKNKK